MGDAEETHTFCGPRAPGLLCLSDPERSAYRAYGLGLVGFSEVFAPSVMIAGAQGMLEGHGQGTPMGEPRQMPGLFVIAPGGRILLAHYSRTVADHGNNNDIVTALRTWSEQPGFR
jgi:peroxiredoxin